MKDIWAECLGPLVSSYTESRDQLCDRRFTFVAVHNILKQFLPGEVYVWGGLVVVVQRCETVLHAPHSKHDLGVRPPAGNIMTLRLRLP